MLGVWGTQHIAALACSLHGIHHHSSTTHRLSYSSFHSLGLVDSECLQYSLDTKLGAGIVSIVVILMLFMCICLAYFYSPYSCCAGLKMSSKHAHEAHGP